MSLFRLTIYCGLAAINGLFALPQDDFIAAARRDNLKLAQKALAAGGVEVNAADAKGKSAVLYACENGSVAFVQWLAEQNADLRARDAEGNDCLHLVVRARKNAELIAFAAEKGLDRNAQNSKGQTPLIAAAVAGKKAAIEELIKIQVDLNARDSEGHTALTRSILARRIDQVQVLLAAGAQRDGAPNAPLSVAYDANQYKIFEALQQAGANLNIQHEKSGQPLLVEAVKRERMQFVQFMIAAGADTNVHDAEGNNLMVLAANQNLPDLVQPLLQRGLSLDSRDKSGKTITQIVHENLLKRVTPAREKMFRTIFDNGANANNPSSTGRSLLMEQSEAGRYNQVKVLLEKGADVNFRDRTNNTVLHTTAIRNQLGTMRLVAEKFEDINITGDSGNTAAHFAARSGATGILKLLKDRSANFELKNNAGDTPLSIAIGRTDPATTKALLALGASLSDEGRETPLMLEVAKSGAVNARTTELLAVMRKAGANINAVNRFGNNALSYALSRNNLKMAESFLRAGADPLQQDSRGNSLLHKLALASRYNKIKNQQLIDWLYLVLSYQDANAQNAAGQTALHLAASAENNPDMEGAAQFYERLVDLSAETQLADSAGLSAYEAGRRVGWQTTGAANLPGQPATQGITQPAVTPVADKLLRLSTADRDFYLLVQSGAEYRLLRLNDELEIRAQKSFPAVTAMAAAGDGVVIAGTRPGEIDGAADPKCKPEKNLVVFVAYLDASLNPRWEHTWGKAGACQRTAALAVGHDQQGSTVVQAEFAGRRLLRRLGGDGAAQGEEVSRADRLGEMIFLPDNTAALTAGNTTIDVTTGKNAARITKARGYRTLAVSANGTRLLAGDFQKLPGRRGVTLSAEDAEGRQLWTKQFAGAKALTVEALAASDERFCVIGRANAAVHGQAVSAANDFYVACTNAQGVRTFTRVFPAANLKLADIKVNRRGNVVIVFEGGDRKNPDVVLYRIDASGRIFN